ncbi:hypothetical protein HDU96_000703 [Phlyctochytrium bullatum]|nr:hypothetical protein HDU96_000703 [Phlyctochytrium bullatum]
MRKARQRRGLRRRAPKRVADNEEEVATATVTHYIVVVEETGKPSNLAAVPADGYAFDPNQIVLVERNDGPIAVSVSETAASQAPPKRISDSSSAAKPSPVSSTNNREDASGRIVIPLIVISMLIMVSFLICLIYIARSKYKEEKKKEQEEREGGPITQKNQASSKTAVEKGKKADGTVGPPIPATLRSAQVGVAEDSPKGGKRGMGKVSITITTDRNVLEPVPPQGFPTSPYGNKIPRRSTSIGNPNSPRSLTLKAVSQSLLDPKKKQGFLGMMRSSSKDKREIKNISPPTAVYQGDQLIAAEGHIVDSKDSKDDDANGGRDSTSSTSSSISTVSSGNGETEMRYEVAVPWIPQRFDELALAPGDFVIVYKVYEDGWCDGKHETTEDEGVFPMACLRGRSWSFFGMVDGEEELKPDSEGRTPRDKCVSFLVDKDDAKTVRTAVMEAEGNDVSDQPDGGMDSPVDLSTDDIAEDSYARLPTVTAGTLDALEGKAKVRGTGNLFEDFVEATKENETKQDEATKR